MLNRICNFKKVFDSIVQKQAVHVNINGLIEAGARLFLASSTSCGQQH